MVGRGVALELHFHQDAIAQSNQTAGVKVAVDLWILGPPVINNMLVNEVGFVAIEAVSNENGNVILPSVTRGCGEEYPLVGLGDFQKCFCPGAISCTLPGGKKESRTQRCDSLAQSARLKIVLSTAVTSWMGI